MKLCTKQLLIEKRVVLDYKTITFASIILLIYFTFYGAFFLGIYLYAANFFPLCGLKNQNVLNLLSNPESLKFINSFSKVR